LKNFPSIVSIWVFTLAPDVIVNITIKLSLVEVFFAKYFYSLLNVLTFNFSKTKEKYGWDWGMWGIFFNDLIFEQ